MLKSRFVHLKIEKLKRIMASFFRYAGIIKNLVFVCKIRDLLTKLMMWIVIICQEACFSASSKSINFPFILHHFNYVHFSEIAGQNLSFSCSWTLKLDSDLPRKSQNLLQWKPLKSDKKCFLFHLKICFYSQDIQIFILNFWLDRKNDLIRNIRSISKIITSRRG